MYKSDKEIAAEFNNFKILNIELKSTDSGWIEIEFPYFVLSLQSMKN